MVFIFNLNSLIFIFKIIYKNVITFVETIVKSKSQSTVFKSKSIMKSDGSGNISVTQDFMKG